MRVINKLTLPGKIKNVRISIEEVKIQTVDKVIVYKRETSIERRLK